ncbi:vacuolating cyotoxin family protein [Helicobacter sp. 13S00477-4]|uniref:vacuolating cyotoxin family protein n=1 Tax=Helicobacter sp. 13S00477-4 TaxID=1905759 RepID=UPI000BA53CC8|nr:vacuolating cyotoxin family protein [Helicobacter sp. 13S00477-4]PAF51946.1 hypothetical protein BKH44_04605 [Helicobacter sp. 13S00477-4]
MRFHFKGTIATIIAIILLMSQSLYALTNVTSTFSSLASGSWSSDAIVNGWDGWSDKWAWSKPYTPTYSFGNHTLTFAGGNSPSWGSGGGRMGTQEVTINAGKVIFNPNALLQIGNNMNTNSATVIFNAPLSMGGGSQINVKGKSYLYLKQGITGSANLNIDGKLEANNNTKDFIVSRLYLGKNASISAKNFQTDKLDLYENVTLNAIDVSGSIKIGTFTNTRSGLLSNATAKLDTHSNVAIDTINVGNYGGGRNISIDTHGYGDINLMGSLQVNGSAGGSGLAGSVAGFIFNGKNVTFNSDVTLGYYNKLTVKGVGKFSAKKININNIATAGADSILDFSGMMGNTNIQTLELRTASVYGKNFTIGNLIEHKGASRSVFYTDIGTSSINNLTLEGGSSNADNTILEFKGGGNSLNITGTADIQSWGVLDASTIKTLIIDNLKSSYATIKAKDLTVNNATFSNNKTYLYADNTHSNGTISLDNAAELWLKSGQNFNTNTLNMNNGSALFAAKNNGGMSGTTTINHIQFNNSKIYANNLITQDISIQNNANVYLNNGTYTNQGDLNISDGSYLQVHGGDFINNGELNITMGADPTKNAKNLINVLDGSFTFDMTKYNQSIPVYDNNGNQTGTITNQVPKAAINVKLNLSGLSAGQTYNLLTTKNGINFKDGSILYTPSVDGYNTYKTELNGRMFFSTADGSSVGMSYWMSDDNKSIGFQYTTGKHYVDATPFIKPGVWVLGIGSGAAAFGSIGGIPGASGLAKDYTLKLQAQNYHNAITGKDEPTVYYIQNLSYNNYGNRDAKFTVDASGSDFVLGKDQDIGGLRGTINIGPYNAKSTMDIKANNIYLGGTINLGDGALISGHLVLEGSEKIIGDDPSSVINIKNHSSFKATGTSFDFAGTINATANKTVTDEVGLDLGGIKGNTTIGTLNTAAARPNSVDNTAGLKMKDFTINNFNVYKGNGGKINNYYTEFTTNIGTSKIENLNLEAGTSGLDQSGLKFSAGGDSLTIGTANIGAWSFLDASKITDTIITKELDLPYSAKITFDGGIHGVIFNNLTLEQGSVMNYGGAGLLTINGNFTNNNGTINIVGSGGTINPVTVKGNATFLFNDDNLASNGTVPPLIKVSGFKFNTKYTIFKVDGSGSITYVYTNKDGKTIKSSDSNGNNSNGNGLWSEMAEDRIMLSDGSGKSVDGADISVDNRSISFIINESNVGNPYDPNDIRYWFYKRGGQKWIDAINDVDKDVMDWLQILMLDPKYGHDGAYAKTKVYGNDLNYFLGVAQKLADTMTQLSSVNRKNNSTAAFRLATDVNKTSRLVKLSNTQGYKPSFSDAIRELQNKKFAVASNDTASIYKFTNRNEYKNNIWATGIGAASFVQGGNSTLYGLNVGYDRFINLGANGLIVGVYGAYAMGNYTGDIINNRSSNANIGLYSRAYVGNNEFDISASNTLGYNKEKIYSVDTIFSALFQNYHYYTDTTNVNVNYGYVFEIKDKSVVIKPQIGLSYYFIAATKIRGIMDNPAYEDLAMQADADLKQDLALNLAIETRQYFNSASYWYFIAGVSRDLLLKSKGDTEVRFVGNNTLSYKNGDEFNTYASLTAGGELELFKRFYVNLGLGAKAGIAYKDININGSLGMRLVF